MMTVDDKSVPERDAKGTLTLKSHTVAMSDDGKRLFSRSDDPGRSPNHSAGSKPYNHQAPG